MGNKKIPTSIGTIVIIIIAVTVGAFIWLGNKESELDLSLPENQRDLQASQTENENMQASRQIAKPGFQRNGKTITGNGIEAYFEDGIFSFNETEVVFSPKDRFIPEGGESQIGAPEDVYILDVRDYRTAEAIIQEANESPLNTKKPIQKHINGLTIVEWADGGFCDNRNAEVIGKSYNYVFSSLGCHHNEQADFGSFEKVILTIKFID